jgi:hypothetical protein
MLVRVVPNNKKKVNKKCNENLKYWLWIPPFCVGDDLK